ncbi:uncharacterized protein JCM10292_005106 [Rhodotorula paludigena]|uniref:uncharacterized protein n=1 Tax=Rhodotorula paludigena TaxID=86838 RepID=UPI003180D276
MPTHRDSLPFARESPPSQPAPPRLPTSASESLLAHTRRAPPQPKPPAQPTRVRPFLLRGSSRGAKQGEQCTLADKGGSAPKKSAEEEAAGLRKSKTNVELSKTADAGSPAVDGTDKRRQARALPGPNPAADVPRQHFDSSNKRSSLTRSRLPPISSSSSAPARPRLLAISSLRSLSGSDSTSTSAGTTTTSRPRPTPRSRPLSYIASSPPPGSSSLHPISPPRRSRPLSAITPSPPSISQVASHTPAASAAVAQHKLALKRRTLAARQQGGAPPAADHVAQTSNEPSALLLEQHGYADTRVITPQAARTQHSTTMTPSYETPTRPRSPAPPAASSSPSKPADSSLLAPPAAQADSKSLKEKSSLLSLRGWFSLFGSTSEEVEQSATTDAIPPEPPAPLPAAQDSPAPRMRSASELRNWVSGVAEAYAPAATVEQAPHPLSQAFPPAASSSLESTPQLVFCRSSLDEDANSTSARSYSSSLSLDFSPPTPPHHFPHNPVIAVSHETPVKSCGPASALVLRHTASDSRLLPNSGAFPRYESFAGLGIQLPPSSPSPPLSPRTPPTPRAAHFAHSPSVASGAFSSVWIPSLLRERASQLFYGSNGAPSSSSAVGIGGSASVASSRSSSPAPPFASPLEAATGLTPTQRQRLLLAHGRGRNEPMLLRKAVSMGSGLVRVDAKRVESRSSRESLGRLEARETCIDGVDEGLEAFAAGGGGWGEDLLGRRW